MSTNLTKHNFTVTRESREQVNGQKGMVLWFTGVSGSGKSTIANALDDELNKLGKKTYILDGDNIRMGLNKDLSFSPDDRKENIRRISEVAKLFADSGTIVLTAFISPYIDDRQAARDLIGEDFNEVLLTLTLKNVLKETLRDCIKKALSGEIKGFTGIDAPYEKPTNPEIVIKNLSISESVESLLKYII